MRLKVTVFPLENVVSLIEGCKKEKKNLFKHPTRLVIAGWVSLIM